MVTMTSQVSVDCNRSPWWQSLITVSRGDRVAQLILEKVHMAEIKQVDDLEATARGSGGFGSTGGYRS